MDGCIEGDMSIYDVWLTAMTALRSLSAVIDDAALERLFWRENRMVTGLNPGPYIPLNLRNKLLRITQT